jgi:DNA-binding transcriptional ArsR family regulator
MRGPMMKRKAIPGKPRRFAYPGLDRVIHERARLGVLTSLLTHPTGLSFITLKQLCGLTDGNLARHLQVLEDAKLVDIARGSELNRPQTIYRISPRGRKRYLEYFAVLEQVVLDASAAIAVDPNTKGKEAPAIG